MLIDLPEKKAKFLKPDQYLKLHQTVTVMNLNMITMKLWMNKIMNKVGQISTIATETGTLTSVYFMSPKKIVKLLPCLFS
jgi:hypothetical protein